MEGLQKVVFILARCVVVCSSNNTFLQLESMVLGGIVDRNPLHVCKECTSSNKFCNPLIFSKTMMGLKGQGSWPLSCVSLYCIIFHLMGVCLLTCFYLKSLLTIISLTYIANVGALRMQGKHSTTIWFLGLLHPQWVCDYLVGSYTIQIQL